MGDRERWDARHRVQDAELLVEAADPFVMEALDALGLGVGRRAVDLAAGTGRHALELAARGWAASAWDVSPAALAILARRAESAGLNVEGREVDLAGGLHASGPKRFDLAVVVNFLERPLLADLHRLVREGGHLIFVTFTKERVGDRPRAEWCLEPGELARGVEGFETLSHCEAGGRAGLVGRRAEGVPPRRP